MTLHTTIWSTSAQATAALGDQIGRLARAGDVLALVGELGAGKTQLVRGLARGMGLDPHAVASPTFVFVHEYEPTTPEAPVLVHIDAYRLRRASDLETIGWHLETGGADLRQGAVVAMEWADRVQEALGEESLRIDLQHRGDDRRLVQLSAGSAWQQRWPVLMQALAAVADLRLEAMPHV